MAGTSEGNRQRVALALVGLSMGLILLGFGIILNHLSLPQVATATTRPVHIDPKTKIMVVRQVLFWALVLVLIFGVSSLAFLRWSRHFRRQLFSKPRTPSPSADVWAMHKLPDGALQEWEDDGGQPNDPGDKKDNP